MGRGREFRGSKKRGFDDEMFSPRGSRDTWEARPPQGGFERQHSAPVPDGPTLDATVKWFNGEKGFGFAELADGTGDVFLHIAVLEAAGQEAVQPGTKLRVNVGQGQKGRQITRVLEVDASTAEAPRARPAYGAGGPGRPRAPDSTNAVELVGTARWFNTQKGFGFVAAEDGGKDVFVHISILQRANLTALGEGERVSMEVVDTPKGREAVSIKLLDA